jgi:hypothetical protein
MNGWVIAGLVGLQLWWLVDAANKLVDAISYRPGWEKFYRGVLIAKCIACGLLNAVLLVIFKGLA